MIRLMQLMHIQAIIMTQPMVWYYPAPLPSLSAQSPQVQDLEDPVQLLRVESAGRSGRPRVAVCDSHGSPLTVRTLHHALWPSNRVGWETRLQWIISMMNPTSYYITTVSAINSCFLVKLCIVNPSFHTDCWYTVALYLRERWLVQRSQH